MIRARDSEVAEIRVAIAFRTAHLIFSEKAVAVTPDAHDGNFYASEQLAAHQMQIRTVIIETCPESAGTR